MQNVDLSPPVQINEVQLYQGQRCHFHQETMAALEEAQETSNYQVYRDSSNLWSVPPKVSFHRHD